MSHFSLERLREIERFAEAKELTCFVYCGYTYVMDGGKAAHQDYALGDPEQREWWSSFGFSSRKATEEEIALWSAIGGPT